jgi:hypothetical protein
MIVYLNNVYEKQVRTFDNWLLYATSDSMRTKVGPETNRYQDKSLSSCTEREYGRKSFSDSVGHSGELWVPRTFNL